MRKLFFDCLYKKMRESENIFFICADLGFGLADKIKQDFPERFINTGAAEQAAMGIAVGLALENKIPFVYSITPFLLWRAAEVIRNYVNHESIPVKLIGSGRDKDYHVDGFSHDATDDEQLLSCFENIECEWPQKESEIEAIVEKMINTEKPYYLNLKR